jgi:LPXTG-motif cell wall-anchored protein
MKPLVGVSFLTVVTPLLFCSAASGDEHDTQAALATIAVTPTHVAAGSSVQVSGTCPIDDTPVVEARASVEIGPHQGSGFGGTLRPDHAPDGSFTATFPIPRETDIGTWQFQLACSHSDTFVSSTPMDVTVTPSSPEPMTVNVAPSSPIAGDSAAIVGAGCVADGRPLESAGAVVASWNQTVPYTSMTTTVDAAGAFDADLLIPEDYPAIDSSYLAVICTDLKYRSGQPQWARSVHFPITVLAGNTPATSSTTVTTSVPTTLASQGVPEPSGELPRTGGAPTMLIVLAGAALASGLILRSARPRHQRGRL